MNKPKVIFVRHPSYKEYALAHPRDMVVPLNIAYPASLLTKNGYDVEVVDNVVEGLSFEELCGRISDKKGDIIFIEATTPNAEHLEKLGFALKSKARHIKAIIAMGREAGILASAVIHRNSPIDAYLLSEYDYTIQELAGMFTNPDSSVDLSRIKGIAYFDKEGAGLTVNLERGRMTDLDGVPFLDYSLFNIRKYNKFSAQISSYRSLRWGFLLTSRGCPYKCIYCSPVLRNSWGSDMRYVSAVRAVDEIEHLSRAYRINAFSFEDDNFTFNREHAIGICSEIIKRRLKIRWVAQVHLKHLDRELLSMMKKANCDTLRAAVETGSQRVMDALNRNLDIPTIRRQVALIKQAGISLTLFFMLNNPKETYEEMLQTLRLAKELSPDMIHVYFCTPYPGSRLYESLRGNPVNPEINHLQAVCTNLTSMKTETILSFQKYFYQKFFISGRYIINYLFKRARYNFYRKEEWRLVFSALRYILK